MCKQVFINLLELLKYYKNLWSHSMRLIICLFLFLSSVNASEINCKFHSFISEVNGVKTDHEIDEEDFMLIYYEPENQWLWEYPTDALQNDIHVWKEKNNYSYNKANDFVSSKREYEQKNEQLNIESKRQEIPKEFHRSRAFKLDSKMYLTITTNDLYIYSYYEKKVRVIRKGKCVR